MRLLRDLLSKVTKAVRDRLLAVAPPEIRQTVEQALSKIASDVHHEVAAPRDFTAAVQTISSMQKKGLLNEAVLYGFANTGRYEEAVAALDQDLVREFGSFVRSQDRTSSAAAL